MKQFTTGIIVSGDSKGAVGAVRATREELEQLNVSQRRGKKTTKQYTQQVAKCVNTTDHLRGMIGAATAALGSLYGIMRGADTVIQFGDRVEKLSIRIGASTEALSEYSHVADLTGTNIDQLSIAWQRQTRRIAEAAAGTGEAKAALIELGLSAQALKGLAPEEQFEVIADAMAKVDVQADRVRLGMKLWDSEGVALLQTIKGGSEALRAMRLEARELGLTLTQEQAESLAEFNDSITRIKASAYGLMQQFVVGNADAMTNFFDRIPDYIPPIDSLTNAITRLATVVGTGGALYLGVVHLPVLIGGVAAAFSGFGISVMTTWMAVSAGVGPMAILNASLFDTWAATKKAAKGFGLLKTAVLGAFVAFAGFQFGSYLHDEFLEARLAGLAFVGGMEKLFERLRYYWAYMATSISHVWDIALQKMRKPFADFLLEVAEGLSNVPFMEGMAEGIQNYAIEIQGAGKPVEELADKLTKLDQEHQKNLNAIDENIDGLVDYEIAASLAGKATTKLKKDKKELIDETVKLAKTDLDYVKTLGREYQLMQLSARERAVQINLSKLSAEALSSEAEEYVNLRAKVESLTVQMYDYGEEQKRVAAQAKPFTDAWEQATERIDETFADAWTGAFDSFSDFADGIKDAFKRLLAEMAHLAITKPIVVNIMSSMGGALGLSTAQDAMATGGNAGGDYSSSWLSGGSLFSSSLATDAAGNVTTEAALANAPWVESSTGLAESMASAAPYMAALAGALEGYNKSGAKGAITGAAGGYGGAKAGAAIGTAIAPGIGTAVGAIIGGMLGAKFGANLFGGEYEAKDFGIQLRVAVGDLVAESFTDLKREGGLFSDDSFKTEVSYNERLSKDLQKILEQLESDVLSGFKQLGFDVSAEVFETFSSGFAKISTEGKTDEEISAAIEEFFTGVADDMVLAAKAKIPEMEELAGELLAALAENPSNETLLEFNAAMKALDLTGLLELPDTFEELEKITNALALVNYSFSVLGNTLHDADVFGARAADSLIEMAGGLEGFTNNVDSFYSLFVETRTDLEILGDDLRSVFSALGEPLPAAREGFKNLVLGLDTATEAGAKAFTILTELSGASDSYYTKIEDRQEAWRKAVISTLEDQIKEQEVLDSAKTGLGIQILELEGKAIEALAASRKKELSFMDESLHPLQQTIYALQDVMEAFDDLGGAFTTASEAAQLAFDQITTAALDSRRDLSGAILSLRRQGSGWNESAFQISQVDMLRGQLGQGSELDQIGIIDSLNSALMSRYDSEKNEILSLQEAARAAHGERLDEYNQLIDLSKSLKEYSSSLLLSDYSPLTNEQRLREAQGQYGSTLMQAQRGDLGAMGQLSSISDSYLKTAREFYGSSSEFTAIFDSVRTGIGFAADSSARTPSPGQMFDDSTFAARLTELQEQGVQELQELDDLLAGLQSDAQINLQNTMADLETTYREETAKVVGAVGAQAAMLGANLEVLNAKIAELNDGMNEQIGATQATSAEQVQQLKDLVDGLETLNRRTEENTQNVNAA